MAGVWLPFKELASVVTSAVLYKQSDFYYTLEAVLKKHKPDFISLLQNPVRKKWEGGLEGEMEREGGVRREREGMEGDKEERGRERELEELKETRVGGRGRESYVHVQLRNTRHSAVSLVLYPRP